MLGACLVLLQYRQQRTTPELAWGPACAVLLMAVAFCRPRRTSACRCARSTGARVGSAPLSNEILTGGASSPLGTRRLLSVTGKAQRRAAQGLDRADPAGQCAFLICMCAYMIDTRADLEYVADAGGSVDRPDRRPAADVNGWPPPASRATGFGAAGHCRPALLAGVVMTLVQQASLLHITSSIPVGY